ncbi:MAG TPA: DUF3300 domain-containing protein [Thermodesulfovibrionales bacterium]|nr:DUF3300 domain-containing protein [Thermodesulfovibrionales bacterium]
MTKSIMRIVSILMIFALIAPFDPITSGAAAQEAAKPVFSPEELEQVLAPIALYPDSLLTQVLMASTYPLEVVQADRWAKQNKDMKGDALAKALEAQSWDPSVKSLVNFPQVLTMMSEKLDWTQKLGDAFLAQQKDVLDTVQKLRAKAQAAGNLKTTKEQVVKVEQEVIIIEPASPQVIYVPAYNPTVVYGTWAYPAYPPYPVYPPGYVAGAAFVTGVALGAAWGYAWGHSDWHGGDVNVNVNRNANFNNNINRGKYATQYQGRGQAGQGRWQHDASHRGGVAYRDQGTAQKYNRASTNQAVQSRENYRGRAEAGRQDIARGGADQFKGQRGGQQPRAGTTGAGGRDYSGQKSNALSGMDRGGSATRDMSNRGSSSRQSMSSGSRGGGGGGGSRGGGGGRGGGRR